MMMSRKFLTAVLAFLVVVVCGTNVALWLRLRSVQQAVSDMRKQEADRLRERYETLGRSILEVAGITAGQWKAVSARAAAANARYALVIRAESVSCMSCFSFHANQIRDVVKAFSVPIVAICDSNYFKLLRWELGSAMHLTPSRQHRQGLAIFLTSLGGRVLLVDYPSPDRNIESDYFYGAVRSHLLFDEESAEPQQPSS
jgi:hypothetical protein